MGIEAVAVLRLPLGEVSLELKPVGQEVGIFRGLGGQRLRLVAAEDATLVHMAAPFGAEPEELGAMLRSMLGALLDRHEDPRGIFVLPDRALPKASQYDELIAEAGEIGFWVPIPATAELSSPLGGAGAAGLESALREMMGALPPGGLAEVSRLMAGMDPAVLGKAAEQLQAALAGKEDKLMAALEQSMGLAKELFGPQMPGGAGAAPLDLSALPLPIPSEEQAPELWKQAQEQAEALRQQHPERFAELERKLGIAPNASPNRAPGAAGEGQVTPGAKPKP